LHPDQLMPAERRAARLPHPRPPDAILGPRG
jgi:hypothetical protein